MRVIVIGAGFAGLAAADRLAGQGVEVTVLEARERVGGRVWSVPFAGTVVELGAEFVMPDYEVMPAMCARFGLELVRKGTLYGLREPRGGAPVKLADIEAGLRRLSSGSGETVQEVLAGAGLEPGVAEAIRARIEISCTCPAADLAPAVLDEVAGAFGTFDTHTVDGGNQALAEALAADLPGGVRLGSPVQRIEWDQDGVRVDGFIADAAILTVPASVTPRISFEPQLPPAKRAALAAVRYGEAAKLFVRLASPVEPSAVMSVPGRYWCWTQLGRDGRPVPVLSAFAGSELALRRIDVRSGPQAWLGSLAELRPELDLHSEETRLAVWDASEEWAGGSYSAPTVSSPIDTDALCRAVGRLHFAGEHTAGRWHGLMEGALRSGLRAADEVLASVGAWV